MRICMLTRVMPAHGKGGLQDHVLMLAENIARRGHKVVVLTTRLESGVQVEETNAVKIYYLEGTVPSSYFGGWWEKSLEKIEELHRLENFDIIHSQSSAAYFLLKKKLNKNYGIPVVTSLHGTAYDEIKTRTGFLSLFSPIPSLKSIFAIVHEFYSHLKYAVPLVKNSDAVIATSNEQAEIFKKIYPGAGGKIFKVFNGIDTGQFMPQNIALKRHSILVVARIEKDKGVQNLIRAMPLIIKEVEDAKLIIIGDGSYLENIKNLAQDLDVSQSIEFKGMLPFESLPEHFSSCDLFVNPTIRQNGYDLTILEAMACEKPVVVSNIGSVPTVIENGVDGILVPPGNIKKLAEAVVNVLTDKELAQRLGRAARKKVLENFSVESMVEGTINAYEEVIRRHKNKEVKIT